MSDINLPSRKVRASIPGMSGFDEVESGEHLTNGATVASAEWSVANDLKTADGATSLTVTDETDADLAAFFAGELLGALQVLTPEANRIMTAVSANWANGNLAGWSLSGDHIRAYGDAADEYFSLAAQYAPMTAGQVFEMTLYAEVDTWFGSGWDFQDAGGRDLILTADTPTGPGGSAFWCEDRPVNAVFKFTAPTGTSGGFKVKAHGGASEVKYFDNFVLVNTDAKAIAVGLVFKVGGTGDTTDNALAAAKGSAPANNDLFAVTDISTETVVYIGNAVGSYAFATGNGSATSTLTQTAANRTTAGINAKGKALKEYQLTYTVAVKQAIAPAGALAVTIETFGTSTPMPITAGNHAIYFQSASDAATADFVIQAVGSSVTAGVISISALTLMRCCDSVINPDTNEWTMIRPLEADATLSAVATVGDDLTSMTLAVLEADPSLRGRWTRIVPSSGRIAAYRL